MVFVGFVFVGLLCLAVDFLFGEEVSMWFLCGIFGVAFGWVYADLKDFFSKSKEEEDFRDLIKCSGIMRDLIMRGEDNAPAEKER